MASPFQVGTTLANNASLGFSPQNRIAILGDGSVLVADNSSATVVDLWQITSPSSASPTITSINTFTYGGGSTTSLVADLLVIQNGAGAGVDDIWLVLCSDATAGTTIEVVHGTYTQSTTTFAWDTKTTAATPSSAFSQTASIAWNGTDLMVAFRDGTSPWVVKLTYTSTKNGTAGWQAPFVLNTNANSGSHCNPMLRHDAKLAGGSNGATICLYTRDSSSSHSDQWAARVLLDSAASAASANWKAEVLGGPTAQNIGTALHGVCVDPANGNVHLAWNSSTAGTGAIGTSYIPVTVNSSGTPSFGTRVLVSSTSGESVGICVDALSRIYVFFSTAAVGSNSVIDYEHSDSPYSTFSALQTTVFATATTGSNTPHVPSHDQAVSGYVPLLVQNGKTSGWTAQFDNTVSAQSPPPAALSGQADGVSEFTGGLTEDIALSGETDSLSVLSGDLSTATGTSLSGTASGSATMAGTLSQAVALSGETDGITVPSGQLGEAVALSGTISTRSGFASTFFTYPVGLVVSTQTQSGISGGPPGNNTTETDITWTDTSGNGTRVGIIPAYGGAELSATYEIAGGGVVNGIPQTSLSTSSPDGFIHVLANNGVFSGSEDPTFTLTEIGFGSLERRMYDSGTITPATGPALSYRIRVAIYPGDPMLIFTQIDIINSAGTAITLNGTDGIEVALIGGRTTANQGAAAADAWPGTNGLYATSIGGTETAWPGDTTPGPQAADPVYVYIKPTTNTGLSNAVFNIKILGLGPDISLGTTPKISYLGPPDSTSSRVKVKVQVTLSSFPATTTKSPQYVQGFKRNPAAGDINSIAADLRNPDASSIVKQGTPASPFFDQLNGWYDIAAVSNGVLLTHTIPSGGTARWVPAYRITNWTDTSGSVPVSLNGVPLVAGSDYLTAVDTTNHIAYVKLMRSLVASGAGVGQLNNGPLLIGTALIGSSTGTSGLSGNLGFIRQLTGVTGPVSSMSGTLSLALAVNGGTAGITSTAGTLSEAVAVTGSVSGASSETGALTQAIALGGAATSIGTTGGNLTTGAQVVLQGSTTSSGQMSATLSMAVAIQGQTAGVSGSQASLNQALGLAGATGLTSAATGNLQLVTGTQISGTAGSSSSMSGVLSSAASLGASSSSSSQFSATLALAVAIAGSSGSPAALSGNLQILTGTPLSGSTTGASKMSATLQLGIALTANPALVGNLSATAAMAVRMQGTAQGISSWICVNVLAKPIFILVEAHSRDGRVPVSSRDGKFNAQSRDGKFKAGVS